MTIKLQIL